jgi:hypothetical protein
MAVAAPVPEPEAPEPRPEPAVQVAAPLVEPAERAGLDGFTPLQIMVFVVMIAVAAVVGASGARR